MKNTYRLAIPKYLSVGWGNSEQLSRYLGELKITNPFLVIDPKVAGTGKGSQLVEVVKNFGGSVFREFTSNPKTFEIDKAVIAFKDAGPNGIVAVGGGSGIDLAKVATLTALNGGRVVEYLNGEREGTESFPPFIALPTTCGTGSEASPYAVVSDPQSKRKRGIEDLRFLPELVILDPEFLMTLDKMLIASTGLDALTHVLESYLSKKANAITRTAVKGLLLSAKTSLEGVIKKKPESLETLMQMAFSSRLLYPRTGLTIAHALSHPLGAHTDIHHGLAVTFFLPESLKMNQPYCQNEFNELVSLFGLDNIDSFYAWLDGYVEETGIETAIQNSLRGKKLELEVIAKEGLKSSNIPSNPKPVKEEDMIKVVKESAHYWNI